MSRVQFFFDDRKITIRNKKRLKLFIEELFRKEKKLLKGLLYIFCSDDRLLEINREFLKHDFYTDVITFSLGQKKEEIEGEVYISIDRIKENSGQMAISFNEELHRIIFHGALHLCGYNDKKTSEIVEMREKENYYILQYFKVIN